ncbi:MAG: TIGR03086 family metal-binding protein [Pseudonocardiaceae bacterium]
MNPRELLVHAIDPVIAVVEGVKPHQLGLPTPCSDYDVRGLINHFAGTAGWLESMGRRLPPDADDPFGANKDVTTGNWQGLLATRIRAVAAAWDEPSAWEGSIEDIQMPAAMIGEMALIELLMHGWDLARATGQQVDYSNEAAYEAYRFAEETAEMGRKMGAYGAEVPVPNSAPAFDRALGLTGRDPNWTP